MPVIIEQESRAVQLTAASSQFLSVPDRSELRTLGGTITVACWVRLDTLADQVFVSKWEETGNQREWRIGYDSGLAKLYFGLSTDGTATGAIHSSVAISANTWYFVVATYDPADPFDGTKIQVNTTENTTGYDSIFSGSAAFRVGAQGASSPRYANGRVNLVGFWQRLLTAAEKTGLYNGGKGVPYAKLPASLKTDLKGYWDLSEKEGDRKDGHGGHHLAATNAPGWSSGVYDAIKKVRPRIARVSGGGGSVKFDSAKSEYLFRAYEAGLSAGDIDFSWAGWFYLDSLPGSNTFDLINKGTQFTSSSDYRVHLSGSSLTFAVGKSPSGASAIATVPSPVERSWHFFVGVHDTTNNEIKISIDGGAFIVVTGINTGQANTDALRLGSTSNGFNFLDGRMAKVGFWKRTLSQAEVATLYNDGIGLLHSELPASLTTNLNAYWNLDEVRGVRYDSTSGGYHLTEPTGKPVCGGHGILEDGHPPAVRSGNRAVTLVGTPGVSGGQFLSCPDSADLSAASGEAFVICAWARPDRVDSALRSVAAKGSVFSSGGEYHLMLDAANNWRFQMRRADNTNYDGPVSTAYGTAKIGEWVFLMGWYDPSDTGAQLKLQVNNGTINAAGAGGAIGYNGTNPFHIGNDNAGRYFHGAIDRVAVWKGRVLTGDERKQLWNNGRGLTYETLPDSLKTNLYAWWALNEANGTRYDCHGGNHLAENNGPIPASGGNVPGQRDRAVVVNENRALWTQSAKSHYLSRADSADLSVGNESFGVSAWVRFEMLRTGQRMGVISKSSGGGSNQIEWALYYDSGVNAFRFILGDGSSTGSVTLPAYGVPKIGKWIHIAAWYDATTDKIHLRADDTTENNNTWANGSNDGSGDVEIGRSLRTNTDLFDGQIARIGFWKRTFSPADITRLYNNGRSLEYEELPASLKTSLKAYWNLSEGSGTRYDSHGQNHLASNNGVLSAPGIGGTGADLTDQDRGAQFDGLAQYLSVPHNASLSPGDTSFSFSAWVYFDVVDTQQRPVLSKYRFSGGDNRQYLLYLDGSSNFRWIVSPNGTSTPNIGVATLVPTAKRWYHLYCWHDAANDQIGIRIDDEFEAIGVQSGGVYQTSVPQFQIGNWDGGSVEFPGRIDKVGYFNRKLTSAEVTELFNRGKGKKLSALSSDLAAACVSYWELDEESGTRRDSKGTNHLSENGGTIYAVRPPVLPVSTVENVERGAQFVASKSQYLSRADNAALSMGNIDFTIAGWIWLEKVSSGNFGLISKWQSGGKKEYVLAYDSSTNRFYFAVTSDGTNNYTPVSDTTALAAGRWYFVVAWHDAANDALKIQINDGTVATAVYALGVSDLSAMFSIGSEGGVSPVDGRLEKVGVWKRALTADERTSLYNSGRGLTFQELSADLASGLTAYWNLSEESGTRKDSYGTNDLSENNGPIYAVGNTRNLPVVARAIGCRSASFNSSRLQSLSVADNADLSMGNIDFTIAGWVRLADKTAYRGIISKSTSTWEYALRFQRDLDRYQFLVSNNGSSLQSVQADAYGSPQPDQWAFIVAYHDATGDVIGISVNDGPVNTAAHTTGVLDGSAAFTLGAQATPADYLNGQMENVGVWKRLLTAAERTQLFNAGRGLKYSELPASLKLDLKAYYNLDEAAGQRSDSHGTNHLTSNSASVPQVFSEFGQSVRDGYRLPIYNGDRALQLTRASNQFLQRADTDDLSGPGENDFAIAAWVYFDTTGAGVSGLAESIFVSKYVSASNAEYLLYSGSGQPHQRQILFLVSATGSGVTTLSHTGYSLPERRWFFVVAWYDHAAGRIYLRLNDAHEANGAHTGGIYGGSTAPFKIGSYGALNAPSSPHNGRIAKVGVWHRKLTAAEMTALYNGGNGLAYAELSEALKTSLKAYYDLDEIDGTRYDRHGSNHLSPVGSPNLPTWAPGVKGGS